MVEQQQTGRQQQMSGAQPHTQEGVPEVVRGARMPMSYRGCYRGDRGGAGGSYHSQSGVGDGGSDAGGGAVGDEGGGGRGGCIYSAGDAEHPLEHAMSPYAAAAHSSGVAGGASSDDVGGAAWVMTRADGDSLSAFDPSLNAMIEAAWQEGPGALVHVVGGCCRGARTEIA
jgi:hypothetical protein